MVLAQHVKGRHSVPDVAVASAVNLDPNLNDESLGGAWLFQLFQTGDAESFQVVFSRCQCRVGQPQFMPELSAGVFAVDDFQAHSVAGGAVRRLEQPSADNAGDVNAFGHG